MPYAKVVRMRNFTAKFRSHSINFAQDLTDIITDLPRAPEKLGITFVGKMKAGVKIANFRINKIKTLRALDRLID